MPVREITQFSMAESITFVKECRQPVGLRELAMAQFAVQVAGKPNASFAAQGGMDNIQRVRVLGDHGKPLDQQDLKFEFVLKLPLHILEQKRREAEREKRQQECLAKAKELASDPKKLDEFIAKVAIGILGRAAAELLRVGKPQRGSPALKRGLEALKPRGPRRPLSKEDIFERAARQDRANRIEAAKAAAKRFHKEHDKTKPAQP